MTSTKWSGNPHAKRSAACVKCWTPVSDCIIAVRFHSRFIKTSVIQVYAPINDADKKARDDFYDLLQKMMDSAPRNDMVTGTPRWEERRKLKMDLLEIIHEREREATMEKGSWHYTQRTVLKQPRQGVRIKTSTNVRVHHLMAFINRPQSGKCKIWKVCERHRFAYN